MVPREGGTGDDSFAKQSNNGDRETLTLARELVRAPSSTLLEPRPPWPPPTRLWRSVVAQFFLRASVTDSHLTSIRSLSSFAFNTPEFDPHRSETDSYETPWRAITTLGSTGNVRSSQGIITWERPSNCRQKAKGALSSHFELTRAKTTNNTLFFKN
ncbi:hypothetical protein ZHAS_00003456 [Anopheles sinensis]|uniref:Uncharacterized protein n=1 Tax=Anopheles sinensis TaxID=74873 RepID=A0A084VED8_ANOSI|nr:hypothetical protein ZHAS_00003456 [Anopheles sinensis]